MADLPSGDLVEATMTLKHPLLAKDAFTLNQQTVFIERFLGRGKSGYSYLTRYRGQMVVLKLMHDEPNPYYQFHGNKVAVETDAARRLQDMGVRIPQLLEFNENRNYLVKQYIDAPLATTLIAQGTVSDNIFRQLIGFAQKAGTMGANLDYFPANFVIANDQLFYIDYELNPYMDEWNLENWGIFYWVNRAGMQRYLESGDILHLNRDSDSGKPITEGFIVPRLRI
jgi:TP53 regulating kinase-like protein